MLVFQDTVVDFPSVTEAGSPVLVESFEGSVLEADGILQDGMVIEEAMSDSELQVVGGHIAEGTHYLGEISHFAQEWKLGFQSQLKPRDGMKIDFIVEVGKLTIKFWIFLEPVQIGIDGKPLMAAAVALCKEAVANAQTDDGPVLNIVDGSEAAYPQRAGTGAGTAVWEKPGPRLAGRARS